MKQVIIFGSQARGNSWEGSDYDILIVVNRRTSDIREKTLDAAVQMMDKYEKFFSPLIYDEEEWQHAQDFPHGWNIKQEGIIV